MLTVLIRVALEPFDKRHNIVHPIEVYRAF